MRLFVFKNNSSDNAAASNYFRFRFIKSAASKTEVYGTTVKLTDSKGQNTITAL
jgi:hypothetical protein